MPPNLPPDRSGRSLLSGSNKPVRNNASHCVFPTGPCCSGRCLEVLFPGLHAPGFHCPRLTLAALPRYFSSSSHLPVFKKYGPILTWRTRVVNAENSTRFRDFFAGDRGLLPNFHGNCKFCLHDSISCDIVDLIPPRRPARRRVLCCANFTQI